MKLKLLGLLSLSILLSLSACSKNNKSSADGSDSATATGAAGNNQSAQTYGVGSNTAFNNNGTNGANAAGTQNAIYYFGFDKSDIKPDAMQNMTAQANFLVAHKADKVRLEGNTDERGSREYNIALGWRRAQSVAAILEQDGVSPKQLDLVSFGKEKPAVAGHNPQAWDKNRRVSLVHKLG